MAKLKVTEIASYIMTIPEETYKKYLSGEYDVHDVFYELQDEIFDYFSSNDIDDIEIQE